MHFAQRHIVSFTVPRAWDGAVASAWVGAGLWKLNFREFGAWCVTPPFGLGEIVIVCSNGNTRVFISRIPPLSHSPSELMDALRAAVAPRISPFLNWLGV